MRFRIASVALCGLFVLSAGVASAEQLTEAQYKSIMATKAQFDTRNPSGGYAKLSNPHKALAAARAW